MDIKTKFSNIMHIYITTDENIRTKYLNDNATQTKLLYDFSPTNGINPHYINPNQKDLQLCMINRAFNLQIPINIVTAKLVLNSNYEHPFFLSIVNTNDKSFENSTLIHLNEIAEIIKKKNSNIKFGYIDCNTFKIYIETLYGTASVACPRFMILDLVNESYYELDCNNVLINIENVQNTINLYNSKQLKMHFIYSLPYRIYKKGQKYVATYIYRIARFKYSLLFMVSVFVIIAISLRIYKNQNTMHKYNKPESMANQYLDIHIVK